MARKRSLTNLIADVRNRSGLEDSDFRTDTDITRYLNESGLALARKILAHYPNALYLYKSGTIAVTSGTAEYDLPSDCFQPLAFRVTLNGERVNIPQADIDDLDIEATNAGWGLSGTEPKHRIMGWANDSEVPQVVFMPTPTASYTVTCHYIPQLFFWDSDASGHVSDMSHLTNHHMLSEFGFEDWVVLDAAIKIKDDQEEDTRPLYFALDRAWEDISLLVRNRTVTEPPRIRDAFADMFEPRRLRRRI